MLLLADAPRGRGRTAASATVTRCCCWPKRTQPPAFIQIETACLDRRPARSEAAEILLLLHPAGTRMPARHQAWLARRPVTGHVHLRPELERDMARLARLLSRNAVGLVLAGGGARGFAHLGVWRALHEHGIEIDFVGGTSIGAMMAR